MNKLIRKRLLFSHLSHTYICKLDIIVINFSFPLLKIIEKKFQNHKKNHMPKRRKSHLKVNADYLPARILLFRHAEKPTDDKSDPNLNERGYSRAGAIPPFYYSVFKNADRIYATANTPSSKRPYETALPLANAYNVKINDNYGKDQYGNLAKDLFNDSTMQGKTVVIFWHHGELANFVQALG